MKKLSSCIIVLALVFGTLPTIHATPTHKNSTVFNPQGPVYQATSVYSVEQGLVGKESPREVQEAICAGNTGILLPSGDCAEGYQLWVRICFAAPDGFYTEEAGSIPCQT